MNAGCYGGETWRYVREVEVLDARRRVRACARRCDYAIGYRSVRRADGAAPDGVFTAAWFEFPEGDRRAARARITELLEAAHRDAAARPAQRGQRVPQSATAITRRG